MASDVGNSLVLQIVLEQIPGEFMGELEALDQALLLQLAQRSLPRQIHAALQHLQGPLEVVEPLAPAEIGKGQLLRQGAAQPRAGDHRPAGLSASMQAWISTASSLSPISSMNPSQGFRRFSRLSPPGNR
jgi:hypothetical protein